MNIKPTINFIKLLLNGLIISFIKTFGTKNVKNAQREPFIIPTSIECDNVYFAALTKIPVIANLSIKDFNTIS